MTLSDINSTSRRTGCFIQLNAGCLVFVVEDLFEEMFSSAWCVLTGLLGYETLHTRDDVEIETRPKQLLLQLSHLPLALGPCPPFLMVCMLVSSRHEFVPCPASQIVWTPLTTNSKQPDDLVHSGSESMASL